MSKEITNMRYDAVKDIFDRVLEEFHCAEFSEYIGMTGGDARTFRVYGRTKDTLQVYER